MQVTDQPVRGIVAIMPCLYEPPVSHALMQVWKSYNVSIRPPPFGPDARSGCWAISGQTGANVCGAAGTASVIDESQQLVGKRDRARARHWSLRQEHLRDVGSPVLRYRAGLPH
jgi:hypothetical protein